MNIEAVYEVEWDPGTEVYHYSVWLVRDGKRSTWPDDSGCSIAPHILNWNRRTCLRLAKRAARRLLKRELHRDDVIRGAVTTNGARPYAELEGRIKELEAELGL